MDHDACSVLFPHGTISTVRHRGYAALDAAGDGKVDVAVGVAGSMDKGYVSGAWFYLGWMWKVNPSTPRGFR